MKKFRSLLVVLMALLVLTGCEFGSSKKDSQNEVENNIEEKDNTKKEEKKGNTKKPNDVVTTGDKILSCTMTVSGMKTDMTYTFENGKISTIKVIASIDLSSMGIDESMMDIVAQTMGSEYMNQIRQSYGLPENQEGFEVSFDVNKEKISIDTSIYVDVNKIDPELLNDNNLFNKEDLSKSYDEIKSQIIASGATCN